MDSLKAIIFDMDGTLADTEDFHRQAFNASFSEFNLGWYWSKDDYKRLLGISGGRERILACLQDEETSSFNNRHLLEQAKAIHQKKSILYRDLLLQENVPLRPGVERLITEATTAKLSMAIATSSSRKNLETLLCNNLGKDACSLFSVLVTSDTVMEKKPSPAVYQRALLELNFQACDCIAIEDTQNGNLAALAAGLTTIITTHGYTCDDDFSGAALVLDQLGGPLNSFCVYAGNSHEHDYANLDLLCTIRKSFNLGESIQRPVVAAA